MEQKLTQQQALTARHDSLTRSDSAALLEQAATQVLALAKQEGASEVAVSASTSQGFNISVRMGKMDTVEHQRDQGISIALYFGQRKAEVSSSDMSAAALAAAVKKARYIANYMAEDPCYGLPPLERIATTFPNLQLDHPWEITTEAAIELAQNCEALALNYDKRISNSEGVEVGSQRGISLYADSRGFMASSPRTNHSLYCCLIAQAEGKMERDYSYAWVRDMADMPTINTLAQRSAEKTVSRLGARKIDSCTVPVIFAAEVAGGLIGHFLSAINGYNLYKEASFLIGQLQQPVFGRHIQIYESPHLAKGLGSCAFDHEGVATAEKDFIHEGVLQSYLLDSYSARRLNMATTGNAGGAHNLFITPTAGDLTVLLKKMERGLLVTELLGQGVNLVTGDYSRGASGFWVEQGEIQYPVSEVTVVGNLQQMYANLVAVGNDVYPYSNIHSGSILLESMVVAGR
ncbi:MAG: metalloprotease PmbA [Gammaproteobacteria bacterium]|nr:metalloprotease PmbA [Gammaproteobacteria bacterium]MCP4474544.1 metalloprotease PmbA [Gammaproteobacteria bacterium]